MGFYHQVHADEPRSRASLPIDTNDPQIKILWHCDPIYFFSGYGVYFDISKNIIKKIKMVSDLLGYNRYSFEEVIFKALKEIPQ